MIECFRTRRRELFDGERVSEAANSRPRRLEWCKTPGREKKTEAWGRT